MSEELFLEMVVDIFLDDDVVAVTLHGKFGSANQISSPTQGETESTLTGSYFHGKP